MRRWLFSPRVVIALGLAVADGGMCLTGTADGFGTAALPCFVVIHTVSFAPVFLLAAGVAFLGAVGAATLRPAPLPAAEEGAP